MNIPKFDQKEIDNATMQPKIPGIYGIPFTTCKKYDTPITPKENFRLLMEGKQPYWQVNCNTDFNCIQPACMPDAQARNKGGFDWFGVDWEFEPRSNAAMVRPGTRRLEELEDWRDMPWPDLSAIDWEADYKANYEGKLDPDRPTLIPVVNGVFERLISLVNFEDALCYLLTDREEVAAFFDRLADWYGELFAILKKVYDVDIICFHDDMGSSLNTFFSPALYEELMVPVYQKITAAAHNLGIYVDYHSCGKIETLVPLMIKAGFDAWEGQRNLNDIDTLCQKYGDQIKFLNVMTMPDDDDEAVAEIQRVIDTVGMINSFIFYLVDYKPDRPIYLRDVIYGYSRQRFSEK